MALLNVFLRLKDLLSSRFDSLHQAALVLAFSSVASQLLALIRDRIFASIFGTGRTLDIYYAAFRIPDFLFVTIASLVSMTVLIPYFSREYAKDKEGARAFLDSVFTVFVSLLSVVALVTFFLIPYLARFVAPGFDEVARAQFITISRILLLSPLLLGISGHIASITQSFKKFVSYALSPVLYNVGIILGALFLYPTFGLPGLALGVIAGALFHLLVQVPAVRATGYAPRFLRRPDLARVREVFLASVPRTITLGTTALAGLVLTSIASLLSIGSISAYTFAFNLQSVPLSIIGVSYSMAAFPTLSALFSSGARDKFVSQMVLAARQIIFWSLPVTALFVVLRAQVVRTILGSGNFDWTATRLVAAALALFAISLVAQCLVLLFVRGYYASGSTKTPLYANVLSFVLIVLLAPLLLYVYRNLPEFKYFINSLLRVDDVPGTEVLMLPLAYTIGLFVNLALHWWDFARKYDGFMGLFSRTVRHSLYTAVLSGFLAYQGLNLFDNVFNINTGPGVFLQGLCAGLVGIAGGVALLLVLKNEEFLNILAALRSKFWQAKVLLPAPEEPSQI
ncbi:MAG TPA: lipid II flippase MurJ [Candidatus Paceibacterota bacterium]